MVRRLIVLALIVPSLWGTLEGVRDGTGQLLSGSSQSAGDPENIAEAAGFGSGAEVLRMLHRGDDPRRMLPVRPEVISSSVRWATALEAAVWGRKIELIRLLDTESEFTAEERHRIGCLARDLKADDIASYLGADAACVADATLESVLKRTREGDALGARQ